MRREGLLRIKTEVSKPTFGKKKYHCYAKIKSYKKKFPNSIPPSLRHIEIPDLISELHITKQVKLRGTGEGDCFKAQNNLCTWHNIL